MANVNFDHSAFFSATVETYSVKTEELRALWERDYGWILSALTEIPPKIEVMETRLETSTTEYRSSDEGQRSRTSTSKFTRFKVSHPTLGDREINIRGNEPPTLEILLGKYSHPNRYQSWEEFLGWYQEQAYSAHYKLVRAAWVESTRNPAVREAVDTLLAKGYEAKVCGDYVLIQVSIHCDEGRDKLVRFADVVEPHEKELITPEYLVEEATKEINKILNTAQRRREVFQAQQRKPEIIAEMDRLMKKPIPKGKRIERFDQLCKLGATIGWDERDVARRYNF